MLNLDSETEMTDNLDNIFYEIKTKYFPRWDLGNQWKASGALLDQGKYPGYAGLCDHETKTIFVNPPPDTDEDHIRCLLIHEISHAVTDGYHGKKWEVRFLKAADIAEKLGQITTAQIIRHEVKVYSDNRIKVTSQMIHEMIQGALADNHQATFEHVISQISYELGRTKSDLLKRYSSIEKVFYKEKQFWREYPVERQEDHNDGK